MATKRSTVDDLIESLAGAGAAVARPMFGEYGLYLDGKLIGLVCDDKLYLKPTPAGRELAPDAPLGSPYPGAKPHLTLPPAAWADTAALCKLVRATFAALPALKPRKPRGGAK